jgi:hypothetical protein
LWWQNIFASSALYAFAGLMWNLHWKDGRGILFAFMEDDWPNPDTVPPFSKIMRFALLFMVLVALMMLPFLLSPFLDFTEFFSKW